MSRRASCVAAQAKPQARHASDHFSAVSTLRRPCVPRCVGGRFRFIPSSRRRALSCACPRRLATSARSSQRIALGVNFLASSLRQHSAQPSRVTRGFARYSLARPVVPRPVGVRARQDCFASCIFSGSVCRCASSTRPAMRRTLTNARLFTSDFQPDSGGIVSPRHARLVSRSGGGVLAPRPIPCPALEPRRGHVNPIGGRMSAFDRTPSNPWGNTLPVGAVLTQKPRRSPREMARIRPNQAVSLGLLGLGHALTRVTCGLCGHPGGGGPGERVFVHPG